MFVREPHDLRYSAGRVFVVWPTLGGWVGGGGGEASNPGSPLQILYCSLAAKSESQPNLDCVSEVKSVHVLAHVSCVPCSQGGVQVF